MPKNDHQAPSTANCEPQTTIPSKRPPRRPTRAETLPAIRDRATFVEAHTVQAELLQNYLECPRKGYVRLPSTLTRELDPRRKRDLYANNAWSRIAFVDVVVPRVLAHEGVRAGPVFHVTLAVADHTVPLAEAKDFDCRRVKGLTRQTLRDISFVGMIEGALYRNFGSNGPQIGDFVSWHAHVLTWGASRRAIEDAVNPIRRGRSGLIPDRSSIDVRVVNPARVADKLYYALKGPQKEYRVYSDSDRIDLETGEVLGPIYRQSKRPLRTGDRARLCQAFENRLLDQLFFGSGDGTRLCKTIKREALQPFRAWEKRQPYYRR